MRYILQINTGSFQNCATNPEAVKACLEECIRLLSVDSAIFGWTTDQDVNRAICSVLDHWGIGKYFWLPVFSEVQNPEKAKAFEGVSTNSERSIHLCRDESFDFVCPSSLENMDAAIETCIELTRDLPVDGIFIDRIRYPSAANFADALLGCQCGECRAKYRQAGVDEAALSVLRPQDFIPASLDQGRYGFEHAAADRLFAVRRENITRAAAYLCGAFRARGLRVGLDSFAPCVADYVGQDTIELARLVDFIKPMMYRRTYSPAGIPFELEAIARCCGPDFQRRMQELWGTDPCGEESCMQQIRLLQQAGGNVCPGIEVNEIPEICDADEDYICSSIHSAAAAGCERVVLSWDILRMPQARIETLAAIAGEI